MTASTRRAALGAILAAPLASVPAGAEPSDLARACDWAVAHMAWINANDDPWDDTLLHAEIERFDVVVRRAAAEPSANTADLAAKARLLLMDWSEHVSGHDLTDGEQALGALLREVAALA